MKTRIRFVLAALALPGCASSPTLTEAGSKVKLVSDLSTREASRLESLGRVESSVVRLEGTARIEVRNRAAERGATIVRVSTEPAYCPEEPVEAKSEKNCFRVFGDSFRPKPRRSGRK
jgi:hypothetical protein